MGIMLKDTKSDTPSTVRTVFWYGSIICVMKLFFSKMNLGFMSVPEFTGSDFALALGALGGVYSLDKHVTAGKKDENASPQ